MIKRWCLPIFLTAFTLWAFKAQADGPRIFNLQFSNNPITLSEPFLITFDYEGQVNKIFLENTWETQEEENKKEVIEFPAKPEVKEKTAGLIRLSWASENETAKPYRRIKVWVLDAAGVQSNALSGEVGVIIETGIVEEETKVPMEAKTLFGGKTVLLSARIYKPGSGEKFPLVVMNHGTPRTFQERKNETYFRAQSKVFVRKGFVVVVPARRGYGGSEGEYAESSGSCSDSNYSGPAEEAVKDIKAVIEYMLKKPYIESNKKILLIGQSTGGFSSLAYASRYPEELAGVINFAGGAGSIGSFNVCSESQLIFTMGNFGETSKKLPTLWVYTEEDDFFPPDISRRMFAAYQRSGGNGKLVMLNSEFGHAFFHNSTTIKTWEPIAEKFLKEIYN